MVFNNSNIFAMIIFPVRNSDPSGSMWFAGFDSE